MDPSARRPLGHALADRRFQLVILGGVGLAGWLGLAVLAAASLAQRPAVAGFDLQVILDAARRVAAGLSPYAPAAGSRAIQAESLFYSYPPPMAQALSVVASLPISIALACAALGATFGLGYVGGRLSSAFRRSESSSSVLSTAGDGPGTGGARPTLAIASIALAPFVYPFAVALLFGNVDAWFPLLFGLVLLGAVAMESVDGRGGRSVSPRAVAGGIALALAAVKLSPASLGVWLFARGWRERMGLRLRAPDAVSRIPAAWVVLAIAVTTTGLIVVASVALGGVTAWSDWAHLVRSGTGAEIASRSNIGPGSQVALLLGRPSLAGPVAAASSLVAILIVALAAIRIADPLLSFGSAAAASLVVLPVTWFHYPVALIPVALAAVARAAGRHASGTVNGLVALAVVVAAISIMLPVTLWIAVGLVLLAAQRSAPGSSDDAFRRPLDFRP